MWCHPRRRNLKCHGRVVSLAARLKIKRQTIHPFVLIIKIRVPNVQFKRLPTLIRDLAPSTMATLFWRLSDNLLPARSPAPALGRPRGCLNCHTAHLVQTNPPILFSLAVVSCSRCPAPNEPTPQSTINFSATPTKTTSPSAMQWIEKGKTASWILKMETRVRRINSIRSAMRCSLTLRYGLRRPNRQSRYNCLAHRSSCAFGKRKRKCKRQGRANR